jgi:probable HAF family extracellular repeat protein
MPNAVLPKDKLIPNLCFKVRSLILAAALIGGLGLVTHAAAQERAYLIDLNKRTATQLASLGGATSPRALNDSGQVVGLSGTLAGTYHAFITGPNGAGMTDLGTLGGGYSSASGINNAGQVVGSSDTSSGALHAFITGAVGMNMRDLGTLSKVRSEASDINDKGQVVGQFAEEIAPGIGRIGVRMPLSRARMGRA